MSARACWIRYRLSFNSVDGVSIHRVYMEEAKVKLNTCWGQLDHSVRVEMLQIVLFIAVLFPQNSTTNATRSSSAVSSLLQLSASFLFLWEFLFALSSVTSQMRFLDCGFKPWYSKQREKDSAKSMINSCC